VVTPRFEPPYPERFPCLALAAAAIRVAGTMPAVLSAANEIAVDAFLAGKIGMMDIASAIEQITRGALLPAGRQP
jgi:1-deoxy-D-xylulose-5-phosphate reductoisomerase